MNSTQALAKAKKILGPKAIIQINKRAPIGDARAAEIELRRKLTTELNALKAEKDARLNAVLQGDEEFQRLKREVADLTKRRDNLHAGYHHRVEIGVEGSFYVSIRAGGDNFDEAIAALSK